MARRGEPMAIRLNLKSWDLKMLEKQDEKLLTCQSDVFVRSAILTGNDLAFETELDRKKFDTVTALCSAFGFEIRRRKGEINYAVVTTSELTAEDTQAGENSNAGSVNTEDTQAGGDINAGSINTEYTDADDAEAVFCWCGIIQYGGR